MAPIAYSRVLVKISGEALAGGKGTGFDFDTLFRIAGEVKQAVDTGAAVGLVIGGGNIVRGAQFSKLGMDRVGSDYMGMLGTVINALALQDVLERAGVKTRVMTSINMEQIAEPFIRRRALRHFEKGLVVIFAGGTGNPYFSTDTAAALRAAEMGCDALFKGTSVDGVYTADPKVDKSATRYDRLSYDRVLGDNLKVMDAAAVALCRDNNIPIVVFNIRQPGNLATVLAGEGIATIVQSGD